MTSDTILLDHHANERLQATSRNLHNAEEHEAFKGHVLVVVSERLAALYGHDAQ